MEYNVIIFDTRSKQDPTKQSLNRLLRNTKYTENLTYHLENNTEQQASLPLRLIFQPPWNYLHLSSQDRSSALYTIGINAVKRPVDNQIIESAVKQWYATFSLPTWDDADATYQYNWALATYARSINYQDKFSIVRENPSVLYYKQGENPFLKFIHQSNIPYVELPQLPTNFLDQQASHVLIRYYPIRNNIDLAIAIEDVQREQFSATHLTWTFDAPHFFIYSSLDDCQNHVANKIHEDWILYSEIKQGGVMTVPRVCERLLCFVDDINIRKMNAAGAIYPVEYYKTLEIEGSRVNTLIAIADLLEVEMADDIRSIYDLVKYDHTTFYLNEKQSLITVPYKYQYPYTSTYFLDEIDNQLIYNKTRSVRHHILQIYGDEPVINESDINLLPVDSYTVDFNRVNSYSDNLTGILGYTFSEPIRDEWSSVHMSSSREVAFALFNNTSMTVSNLNNTYRMNNMIGRSRRQFYNNIINETVTLPKQYSDEHLLLASVSRQTLLVDGSKNVSVNDTGNINLRAINASTYKLLALYRYMRAGNMQPETGLSIGFFGAEEEPSIGILNSFYNGEVKIIGVGNRALAPSFRLELPNRSGRYIQSEYVICDIDQTGYEEFEDMVDKTIMILNQCMISSSSFVMKINYPSAYLVNTLVNRVHNSGLYSNNVIIRLVKVAGQHPFTSEVFMHVTESPDDVETNGKYFDNYSFGIYKYRTSQNQNVIINNYKYPRSTNSLVIPSITQHIPSVSIPDVIEKEWPSYGTIFCGSCELEDVPTVLGMLESYCWDVVTFKVEMNDTHCVIFARVDPARMRIASRAAAKYRDINTYRKLLPAGLGLLPLRNFEPYRYDLNVERKLTLISRMTTHLVCRDVLAKFDEGDKLMKTVSIGGRSGEDIFCLPRYMPYYVIDPRAEHSDVLSAVYDWHNISDVFDFENLILEDNTAYLFLFMIMNEPNGDSLSAEDQIKRIISIGNKIKERTNSIALISVYERELGTLLLNSAGVTSLSTNRDGTKVRVGRHEYVDLIDGPSLIEQLEQANIKHTINLATTNHLADISSWFTARYTIEGNHFWEVLAKAIVVIGLTRD